MSVHKRDYRKEHGDKSSGDTKWAYRFTYQKKRYRESGFKNKREAIRAEEKKRAEVIAGDKPVAVNTSMTMGELAKEWMPYRERTVAPNTFMAECQKLKRVLEVFEHHHVSKITIADIQRYQMKRLATGISNRTFNLELALVRALFRYGVQHGYATSNPANDVDALKEVKTDKPIPTNAEFRRFIEVAQRGTSGRQLVVWLYTAAYSGLRPSEVFHLEWTDIDFSKDQIYVRPKDKHDTKNGRFRVVELNKELKPILLDWRREWDKTFTEIGKRHDWVFFHPRSPSQRAQSFRKSFEKARKDAGLPHLTQYTFRHFFISTAVMAGCDLFTIARWAGHSSTVMIDRVYGHISNDHKKKQMAKISFEDGDVGES